MDFKWKKKTDEETDEKTNEQIDTTDMPELESEESATQKKRRKRLKNTNTKPNA